MNINRFFRNRFFAVGGILLFILLGLLLNNVESSEPTLTPFNNEKTKINILTGDLGDWGYLDNSGNTVINPRFSIATPFSEGLAFVSQQDKHGFIDTKGNFKFYIPEDAGVPTEFSEGLAAVKSDGKWGFVNKTGEYVIKPQYEDAIGFKEGLAPVEINKKWGFINKQGDLVIEAKYNYPADFHDGLALLGGNYINPKGDTVISLKSSDGYGAGNYSEGLLVFGKNNKYGVIDVNVKVVIEPQYDIILDFSEGLALVEKNHLFGFVNKTGEAVIPIQYEGAFGFFNGIAGVQKDGKWGIIDTNGNFLFPPQFDGVDSIFPLAPELYPPFSKRSNGMAILTKGTQTFYVLGGGKIRELKH